MQTNSQATLTPRRRPLPSKQLPVSQLLELGIIVWDFAYMNKLPLIRSVNPHLLQFTKQPVPHSINISFDPRSGEQNCGSTMGLKRTPTEPELGLGTQATPQPEGLSKIKRVNAQFDLLSTIGQELERTPTKPELGSGMQVTPQPEGPSRVKHTNAQPDLLSS